MRKKLCLRYYRHHPTLKRQAIELLQAKLICLRQYGTSVSTYLHQQQLSNVNATDIEAQRSPKIYWIKTVDGVDLQLDKVNRHEEHFRMLQAFWKCKIDVEGAKNQNIHPIMPNMKFTQ